MHYRECTSSRSPSQRASSSGLSSSSLIVSQQASIDHEKSSRRIYAIDGVHYAGADKGESLAVAKKTLDFRMFQHALVASNALTLGKRIASGSSRGTYVQEILTNLFHGEKKKMSP